MANNITADPNCISLWRFEEGAMLTDEMGNNDLTYSDADWKPVEDTTIYKEGACSAKWNDGKEEPYVIADASLSADFPLKNGGGSTFSWVAWIRPTNSVFDYACFGKMDVSGIEQACRILYTIDRTWGFISDDNEIDSEILAWYNVWHHVAVTHNGDTNLLKIRVYNSDPETTETFETTLAGGNIVVPGTKPWSIADYNRRYTIRMDELAVFNDILEPSEIDAIRNGTYSGGGGGGPGEQTTGDGGGISTFFSGCTF